MQNLRLHPRFTESESTYLQVIHVHFKMPSTIIWHPYHLSWNCFGVLSIELGSWRALPPSSSTRAQTTEWFHLRDRLIDLPFAKTSSLLIPFLLPTPTTILWTSKLLSKRLDSFDCLLFPPPYSSCFGGWWWWWWWWKSDNTGITIMTTSYK